MGDFGVTELAVARDGLFVGMVREADILLTSADLTAQITPLIRPPLTVFSAGTTGAEALRFLSDHPTASVPVVDSSGSYLGLVTANSVLLAGVKDPPRIGTVGGMATPFGVYLTNGNHWGGAKPWMLALTGSLLFLLFGLSSALVAALDPWITKLPVSQMIQAGIAGFLAIAFAMIGLRLLPLAGIHAAEHMTVHAMERGEPLRVDVVRRMPRVHPRCGTNFAAGAMIFLGLSDAPFFGDRELAFLVAVLTTMIFWRPLGSFLQSAFTTRKPNDKQIQMGIDAANELIAKHNENPGRPPTPLRKLAMSGIHFVMIGSMAMAVVVYVLSQWFPFLNGLIA